MTDLQRDRFASRSRRVVLESFVFALFFQNHPIHKGMYMCIQMYIVVFPPHRKQPLANSQDNTVCRSVFGGILQDDGVCVCGVWGGAQVGLGRGLALGLGARE